MSVAFIKQLAKQCVTRMNSPALSKGKGIKRDRDALEYLCGAGSALALLNTPEANAQLQAVEMTAIMVATRGFSYIEELAKPE